MTRRTMRMMSTATASGRDDATTGPDPETMIRHRQIQMRRGQDDPARSSNAVVAVELVPLKPRRPKSKVDWAEFIRSATEIT